MREVMSPWVAGALLLVGAGAVVSQDDAETPAVVTRLMAGSVHEIVVLNGSVNMLASVGEDGTLVVDTGYAETAAGALEAVEALGGGSAQVIVNTHADSDHVGGNAVLGPEALVIAHAEARRRAGTYFALPAVQSIGSPVLAVTEATTLHFNGEDIRLLPMPGGHTAADMVVYFTGSGVAAVGDLVLTGTFPDADPGRGGDAQHLVSILQELVRTLPPETLLVPGHGDTLRAGDLRGYIAMVEGTIAAVRGEMAVGRSFEDVLARNPLAPWAAWERADEGLSFADWSGQIWASLNGRPAAVDLRPGHGDPDERRRRGGRRDLPAADRLRARKLGLRGEPAQHPRLPAPAAQHDRGGDRRLQTERRGVSQVGEPLRQPRRGLHDGR